MSAARRSTSRRSTSRADTRSDTNVGAATSAGGADEVLDRRERARELGYEGERPHDIPNAVHTIAGVTKETRSDG